LFESKTVDGDGMIVGVSVASIVVAKEGRVVGLHAIDGDVAGNNVGISE
jgi:hypothetical protein